MPWFANDNLSKLTVFFISVSSASHGTQCYQLHLCMLVVQGGQEEQVSRPMWLLGVHAIQK